MICTVPMGDKAMEIQVSTKLLDKSRQTIDRLCDANSGKLPRGAKALFERHVGVSSESLYTAATSHLTLNCSKVSRRLERNGTTYIVMTR